ncbi:uncharacterized protein ACLA_074970 [Aspergillus clavatus NRRL 1]|uniref:Uncharacterized protein n=1 Tax=Aspergillus clavatus (strain ATCC 1007 / CBS 513.65 / DSM 816 / NCTC 3887 / NRRL 1 / QM 1276 / 107) TaxID=344612 RepID=A1C7T8_ASPCL|nr:uncharacterized protein ACLA_074970 [Aspergillus clavatus NRRL 1]EAW14459.1 conserved hypothetical protein [Aspergillus clavatus NRRL 1]
MDLFRQAYTSPAESISPHPTFETLQDAIVREINSHEAFRGPPPEMSLPFTSTSSQDSLGGEQLPTQADLTRNVPAKEVKESQFSRLIRRTSSKKDRKGSECKSISANVPSVAFGRGSRTVRRRHTDAPPPTPGLLNAKQSGTTTSTSQPEEQVTYIDILLRSQKPSPPTTIGSRRAAEAFRDSGRSQFAGIFTSPSVSDLERPSTTPSAYYMRAQTSESSTDGRSCISADDSDEEVIHLPSVGIPRVQIQAVDENNATYMIENTTPRDAYRLMNWSYNARRSVSSKRNPVLDENKAQQCSEHEHQLQGTRSVESY